MPWTINYIFVLIGTFLIAIVATPLVRSLALRVGAVDNPNARRINKKPMPSAGGLAILLAFVLATLVFMPMIIHKDIWHVSYVRYILPVVVGGSVVALTGFIDDILELKPPEKPLYDSSLPLMPGASYWAFGSYNARVFEVWGSNVQPADVADENKWKADGTWKNSGEWTKLADCEIVRPSGCPATSFGDEDLNLYPGAYPPSAEDFAAAAEGFEFPIAADRPAVRYLRLVIKTNWHYNQRKRVSQGELSFYAFEPEPAE